MGCAPCLMRGWRAVAFPLAQDLALPGVRCAGAAGAPQPWLFRSAELGILHDGACMSLPPVQPVCLRDWIPRSLRDPISAASLPARSLPPHVSRGTACHLVQVLLRGWRQEGRGQHQTGRVIPCCQPFAKANLHVWAGAKPEHPRGTNFPLCLKPASLRAHGCLSVWPVIPPSHRGIAPASSFTAACMSCSFSDVPKVLGTCGGGF